MTRPTRVAAGFAFPETPLPTMPPTFRSRAMPTRREQNKLHDVKRGSARERGYDARWDKASRSFVARHPLCRYCEAGAWGDPPRVEPTALTDHLYPPRLFEGVFWIKALWVPSCGPCNSRKLSVERLGEAALDQLAVQIGWPTLTAARPGGGSKV
jgi:hypothetical protein